MLFVVQGTEISNLQKEVSSLQTQVQEFSKYSPDDLKTLARSVTAKLSLVVILLILLKVLNQMPVARDRNFCSVG